MGYETEAWRAPELLDGDTLVYCEHGRVLHNVCYRSHWFRIVQAQMGYCYLLVKHGGGQERIAIGWRKTHLKALELLDSDSRYMMIYTMYDMHKNATRIAVDKTANEYKRAFVDGNLKKRKLRGQSLCKVWIENNISLSH